MNMGATLFAQLMELVPWKTIGCIIERHRVDADVRTLSCADLFCILASARVMDRGYPDLARLYPMHQAGAFCVTRAKSKMNASYLYSAPTDRETGVICDRTIALNCSYVAQDYPEHVRRIRFKDPESDKTLIFLTNNTSLLPLTIAALYKNRWQVECSFKWINQHLRIKRFLGASENAVETQIRCAVFTYVLIAIVQNEL